MNCNYLNLLLFNHHTHFTLRRFCDAKFPLKQTVKNKQFWPTLWASLAFSPLYLGSRGLQLSKQLVLIKMKPSLQVVLKVAFPFKLKIITILAILAMETSIPELKLEFALKLNKNYSMFLQLIPGECVAHILHSTSFCRYGTDI